MNRPVYRHKFHILINSLLASSDSGRLLKPFMYPAGFSQAPEIMENLKNHEKSSMHGKIMEFENN